MQNKRYNGQQILGTLVEIEIYQVKFIKWKIKYIIWFNIVINYVILLYYSMEI
jgi:hypothetical protein